MAVDVYISEEKIQSRIKELASQIEKDYAGKKLYLIGILSGSFVFLADLCRKMELDLEIEFMKASSYGEGTVSSGQVDISLDVKTDLEGKHVLLVEDIVDTGNTISALRPVLQKRKPASLKLASLLFKPARLEQKVDIDYLGFEIEDKFVIGYGLDFAGKYRELPYIGIYSHD